MSKKSVKGEWSFNKKTYFIVDDKSEFEAKEDEIFFTPKDLIGEIVSHNRVVLLSIKEGRIKEDSLHLLNSTRRNLKRGVLVGTKEAVLKKFDKIKFHFENIRKINYSILDNIYMSVVESSQALLLFNDIKFSSPRNIPTKLKDLPQEVKKKVSLDSVKEIIRVFKDYEHSKISLPSGKKLDKLIQKAERFNEEVKNLL